MDIDSVQPSRASVGLMQVQQCLIVTPSTLAAAELGGYINQLPFLAPPEVCVSTDQAEHLLQTKSYDIVWLDMSHPTTAGARLIRSFAGRVPFIVTSANANFAVEGFQLGVADYLLKPFNYLRFTRAVNRALSAQTTPAIGTEHPFLFLKQGHSFQRFDHSDIDYIQAYGIYCKIYGRRQVDVVNETISRLEQALPGQQFLRIHKSYIVNLTKITGYSYRTINVGQHQLSLGAAYRDRFEGFLSLLGKKEEE
ncbi:LytR/AlgR family response regulator transcription factor [Larkinella bovis]|uniref:LytR/AlgR family response regulator transcription factor n=1 Tax=Larkinella bovis TaxID=683041 RepID=A0ABW0IF68_9BACT